MIKKCKILTKNDINMVVDFEGIQVQMPTSHTESFAYVNLENGVYSLSTEDKFLEVFNTLEGDTQSVIRKSTRKKSSQEVTTILPESDHENTSV